MLRRIAHHHHPDRRILWPPEPHSAHPRRVPAHGPHVALGEPDGPAAPRGDDHLPAGLKLAGADQLVPLLQIQGHDPLSPRVAEEGKTDLLDQPLPGGEHHEAVGAELAHRHVGRDPLILLRPDEVEEGAPLRRPPALRNLVDLQPVGPTPIREQQQVGVRRGNKEVFDKIIFLGRRSAQAAPPSPLAPVLLHPRPPDIAGVGDGDDHVLFRDQVFDVEPRLPIDDADLRPAGVSEPLLQRQHVAADQGQHPVPIG